MRMPRPACLVLPLCLSITVHAGDAPRRYFTLVNATHDVVLLVETADSSKQPMTYTPLLLDPLAAGGASTVVQLPAGSCTRDLRMTLRGGSTLLYPHIDTCRATGLRVMPRDLRPSSGTATDSSP